MNVKMHKTNFDAFKLSNLGRNRKKLDLPPEESVQNNLAMQTSSQAQILHKLSIEPGCLTSRQSTSVQKGFEITTNAPFLRNERRDLTSDASGGGFHKNSRSSITSNLYAMRPPI